MLNLISYDVSESLREEFISELRSLKEKLNLPANLPKADKTHQSMGQVSIGYVQDCLTEAKTAPEVPSGLLNLAEIERDLHLIRQLDPILSELAPLTATLQNIRRLAGQDLMAAGNQIRKNFNDASKINPGYKSACERLNKRYELAGRAKETATPVETAG